MEAIKKLESSRLVGIDFLRGIAALMVVLCHFSESLYRYADFKNILSYGWIGVHIFFIVSGYVIVYSLETNGYTTKNFFTFLFKRSIRIDPPYLASIFLLLLLYQLYHLWPEYRGQEVTFNAGRFLAHVFYIVPFTNYNFFMHVYWTLCVEFQFYLLIGIIYFLHTSEQYKIFFLMVFSGLSLIPMPLDYYLIFHYGCIFSLGIALYNYNRTKNNMYLIVLLFSLSVVFYIFHAYVLLFCCISLSAIVYLKRSGKVFLFLGTISYSLYLIHMIILLPVKGFKHHFEILKENELIYFLISILGTVFFAYIYYLCVERGSIRLSKKIQYKKVLLPFNVATVDKHI